LLTDCVIIKILRTVYLALINVLAISAVGGKLKARITCFSGGLCFGNVHWDFVALLNGILHDFRDLGILLQRLHTAI